MKGTLQDTFACQNNTPCKVIREKAVERALLLPECLVLQGFSACLQPPGEEAKEHLTWQSSTKVRHISLLILELGPPLHVNCPGLGHIPDTRVPLSPAQSDSTGLPRKDQQQRETKCVCFLVSHCSSSCSSDDRNNICDARDL